MHILSKAHIIKGTYYWSYILENANLIKTLGITTDATFHLTFVDDNKKKLTRNTQKRVYDLLDKIQAAHDEEDYDDAVFHQKRLQKTLDSYMQITRDDANLKMQKDVTDSAAKDIGYDDAEDLVMGGEADEIAELVDHDDVYESIPEDLVDPFNNALDFVRDNEQGVRDDSDDMVDNARRKILKMIQNPDGYGKEKETGDRLKQMDAPDDYEDSTDDLMKQMGDDGEISGMGAAEKANKKMEIDVLNKRAEEGQGDMIDTEQFGMVTWVNGDADENSFIATNEDGEDIEIDYDEIVRFHNNNDSVMKNLNLESIQNESIEFNSKSKFLFINFLNNFFSLILILIIIL